MKRRTLLYVFVSLLPILLVACSNNGGSKVDDTAIFQLRNNYVTGPTDTEIRALLTECEEYLHGGTGIQHLLNPAYSAMTHPGIVVYNIQGSEVYHGQQANMPALPAGVYIMQSGNGGTKKVIVK